MKGYKLFGICVFTALMILSVPITVYANSSWRWISETRPLDMLPIVVVITLVIEIISIDFIPKVRNIKLVIPVVFIANILSFLVPYAWEGIDDKNVYSAVNSGFDLFTAVDYTSSRCPVYTVSAVYLFITLIVETPAVYLLLRNSVKSRRLLLGVIIGANTVTTLITILIENVFCYGQW